MGQIANTSAYLGEDGTQLLVPGGAPAALSGPIHLCTRADNNNTRYFDGKVAYLGAALPLGSPLAWQEDDSMPSRAVLIPHSLWHSGKPDVPTQQTPRKITLELGCGIAIARLQPAIAST